MRTVSSFRSCSASFTMSIIGQTVSVKERTSVLSTSAARTWKTIELSALHPLNRSEVERLLLLADTTGVHALSKRDRIFLDNMTLPRNG